jgi:hypothetical protein
MPSGTCRPRRLPRGRGDAPELIEDQHGLRRQHLSPDTNAKTPGGLEAASAEMVDLLEPVDRCRDAGLASLELKREVKRVVP